MSHVLHFEAVMLLSAEPEDVICGQEGEMLSGTVTWLYWQTASINCTGGTLRHRYLLNTILDFQSPKLKHGENIIR